MHYQVHKGNPNDETLLADAIERHIETTGTIPQSIATDRGFSSSQNEEALASLGVKRISIPKRGKKSKERAEQEKTRWFKQFQRWRAGGEGTISVLIGSTQIRIREKTEKPPLRSESRCTLF